jgi:hypothetical protein
MILVALVALNLRVAVAIQASLPYFCVPVAVLPFGALQFAAYRIVFRPGPSRFFWTGYLLGGLPLTLSFLVAMSFPGSSEFAANGQHIVIPGSYGHELWVGYFRSASAFVRPRLIRFDPVIFSPVVDSHPGQLAFAFAIAILPQFLPALLGGFLGNLVFKRDRSQKSLSPLPAHSVPAQPV